MSFMSDEYPPLCNVKDMNIKCIYFSIISSNLTFSSMSVHKPNYILALFGILLIYDC